MAKGGASVNWSSPGPVLDVTVTADEQGMELQGNKSNKAISVFVFFAVSEIIRTKNPNLAMRQRRGSLNFPAAPEALHPCDPSP